MSATVRALAMIVAAVAIATAARAASPRDRSFSSRRHGVSVEAPPGWTLSTHTGYPSILVVLLHPGGCRMSVAAAETPARELRELVQENRRGLETQKLTVTKVEPGSAGTIEVEARAPRGGEAVRQSYRLRALRDGNQALVVTMTCKPESLPTQARAFELVLKRLRLEDPTPAPTRPPTPPHVTAPQSQIQPCCGNGEAIARSNHGRVQRSAPRVGPCSEFSRSTQPCAN